jgi:hypothetical protein
VLVIFSCGVFSIVGAILAGLAINRVTTDYAGARRQVMWSWGLLAANFVIGILALIVFFAVGLSSGLDDASYLIWSPGI